MKENRICPQKNCKPICKQRVWRALAIQRTLTDSKSWHMQRVDYRLLDWGARDWMNDKNSAEKKSKGLEHRTSVTGPDLR